MLLDTFDRIVLAEEEHVRTATRVYMDTWLRSHRNGDDAPVVREGRRMRWLERRCSRHWMISLPSANACSRRPWRSHWGPEAIFTMKDVCRLDNEETVAVLRWAATALLRAALREAPASVTTSRGQPSERPIDGRPGPGGGP